MKELYDHPLTSESHILEIGGYHGAWAHEMHQRYKCKVTIFEPCFEFFCILKKRFAGNELVSPIHAAVTTFCHGIVTIKIKGDMTGFYAEGPSEEVASVGFYPVLAYEDFDLVQINAEGAEFELLSDTECLHLIDRLQIQFHPVQNYEKAYAECQQALSKDHRMIYHDEPSHWQIWQRK